MNVITPKVIDIEETKLPEEMTGSVGIILVDAEQGPFHGRVAVLTLVEGGPAEMDGRIHPGDLIASVDGRDVRDWGIENIRLLVHGRVNTICMLEFDRPSAGITYGVALRRTSRHAVEKHEHDLELQLRQAQNELVTEAILHDAAEIRANLEEKDLARLRHELAAATLFKEELQIAHANEVAEMRARQASIADEMCRLKDQLQAAREEIDVERSLRAQSERELQHSRQQLQHSQWHPTSALHGVQI
mmetsp:Transcript_22621/g.52693  ORF Transcript_22621/g.52693 Transcript_22621/m.52693 type:complete len:246 (-) Transcript_22621:46-783(-)|eukprot:CAMPEP_0114554930 /NCGR_PEP_ID=MMETSP0114-20121206/8474_1 /TAXON_ID=31324 /ORGANISM="Goniomonas sp, Strain m" /LENGTH=245 /DNA_ID=CAMNT_0001740013 /DNA_START=108 /DNA_END=845 /DNA_ORIENTATION=+